MLLGGNAVAVGIVEFIVDTQSHLMNIKHKTTTL
jgi:hypothetical protein